MRFWKKCKLVNASLAIAGLLTVASLSIGMASAATPYDGLKNKTSQQPVLPRVVILVEQGHIIRLAPAKLGWQLDSQKIIAATERKGLPVDNKLSLAAGYPTSAPTHNFFGKQVIPEYTKLDGATLNRQITEIAVATKQSAVDAQIITQNGDYAVSPAAPGSRLDVSKAVMAIKSALATGKTTIDLPTVVVQPTVTEASLQPRLQQLKAQRIELASAPVTPRSCADNPAGRQLVLVSISQQHLWACNGPSQAYDTAITSGAYLEGDATPTGTWHIYAKETGIHLTGPTWDDFVNYWMPFYSDYGFHDSSWQTFAYGDAAYASQGSHGCVHLPAAAMAWLYGWAPIGTTVTITN